MWRAALIGLTVAAFALRVHALGAVTLRWDEGWSIALASLPTGEMLALTALDVHPPLYYLLLGLWLSALSPTEFGSRFPSALAATVAVPLAAVAARAWWRVAVSATGAPDRAQPERGHSRPVGPRAGPNRWGAYAGLAAATYAVSAPALVYQSGVVRMYAATAPALLLAAWGVAGLLLTPGQGAGRQAAGYAAGRTPGPGRHRPGYLAAAALGAATSLYLFYYAAFSLAGLWLAALVARPRRVAALVASGLGALAALGPWLVQAVPPLIERLDERTGDASQAGPSLLVLAYEGLKAAAYAEASNLWPLVVPLAVLGLAGAVQPRLWRGLVAAALPVALVCCGVALGTRGHMFAPRYAVVATPFIGLGLGWAAAALAGLSRPVAAVAVLATVAVAVPPLRDSVYLRQAEVFDAFDPAFDHTQLQAAESNDLVVFNILSLAGLYERYRSPDDPAWTYAQLWDPVHEPVAQAVARVAEGARRHERIWLVLYKGTYAADSADLKVWADQAFFPADAFWAEDRLFQSYLVADPPDHEHGVLFLPPGQLDPDSEPEFPAARTGRGGARLVSAGVGRSASGAGIGVALAWRREGAGLPDARIYLHAQNGAGEVVGQRDGYAGYDTRPTTGWPVGELIADRRGLWLPGSSGESVTLRVGLYDPTSGVRWTTLDGDDGVTLGPVAP